MAVVSMMRFAGDADDLLSRMQEHVEPVARRLAPQHGGLGHVVARTGDGILMINFWQNDEGRHAMADEPEIQAAIRAAGFPPPAFEGYEIAQYEFDPAVAGVHA